MKTKPVFTVTAVAAASTTVPLSVYPLLGLIRTRLTLIDFADSHYSNDRNILIEHDPLEVHALANHFSFCMTIS